MRKKILRNILSNRHFGLLGIYQYCFSSLNSFCARIESKSGILHSLSKNGAKEQSIHEYFFDTTEQSRMVV